MLQKNVLGSVLSVFFISGLLCAAFAYVEVDRFIFTATKPYNVEYRKVQNALSVSVKIDKTLTNVRLSNLVCNEFANYYIRTSSTGTKYAMEDIKSERKANDATRFLKDLLEANENNISVQQQGIGYYGALVGEMFVGGQSVNNLLVKKGYCRTIE